MQLAGGLVSGVLSDRFGAKSLLLLSFASSAACYILQAKATDINMLYLSQVRAPFHMDTVFLFCAPTVFPSKAVPFRAVPQVPTLFQHAFMAATAFITAKTPPAERAHMLGFNGVAYGVGMLFGPAIGGAVFCLFVFAASSSVVVCSLGHLVCFSLRVLAVHCNALTGDTRWLQGTLARRTPTATPT
eukprot:SAG22_NODE_1915_length_3318_cov_6.926996_4_plen_187_part_00